MRWFVILCPAAIKSVEYYVEPRIEDEEYEEEGTDGVRRLKTNYITGIPFTVYNYFYLRGCQNMEKSSKK